MPEDQTKFPVEDGVVEKADCTLAVFIARLKFIVIDEAGEMPVASCVGVMLLTTGARVRVCDCAT